MKLLNVIKSNPFAFIALLIAAAISVMLFAYSVVAGAVALVCVIFVAIISAKWYLDSMKRKMDQVRYLSKTLQKEGEEEELEQFPLPVVLIDDAGGIIWYNPQFERIMKDVLKEDPSDLSALLHLPEHIEAIRSGASFEVAGQNGLYTVYPSSTVDNYFALYFIDDTELKTIRTKYKLSRPVVILINVDSLEQAEDLMPHEDYYAMNSDIDRLISKWFSEYNCVFRKFADGRFFAITEKTNLDQMNANRFSIIEKIRGGHFGAADAEITLSIGVGHSDNIKVSEDDAREALDMARGRGGDQVAIKTGDSYEFYGGISSGKEKRGKIRSRVFAAALDEYIEKSSNVLIMGHSFGDFDCIGAAAGVVAIARAKGKNAHIIVNKEKNMALSLIKMLETGTGAISFIPPEKAINELNDNTLLIVVDTMVSHLVEAPPLLNLNPRTVIIDHHRMAVDHIIEGKNTYTLHEPHASSACEMVTELIQYSPSKPKLSQKQAQALLSGIMLDTKDFTLRVSVRTFEAASYLKSCKADTVEVRKLFAATPDENIKVNTIVNKAQFFNRYAISASEFTGPSARLICSKAADALLTVENVDASFVILPIDERTINISARSLGIINVQLIMEALGGGGHHSMAAAQLSDISLDDAFIKLKTAIDQYLASNE